MGKTIGKIVTYLIVILLILGAIAAISFFAMRSQGVTFYVEHNGARYLANGDGGSLFLRTEKAHTFSVKSLTGGEVNYSVKITSNSANNFGFFLNGTAQQFFGTEEESNDYTEVFGLKKKAEGFTLTFPKGYTVKQAIERKYGGEIELQNELQDELCYFMIAVVAGKSKAELWFNFEDLTITLDPPQILF